MTGKSLSRRQQRRGKLAVNQAPSVMCLPTTAVLIDELDAGSFQRLPSGNAALRMRFGTRAIRITAVGETYSIVSCVCDMNMGWV